MQLNTFNQNLQTAQFLAGVNQAFPQGIQTGYNQTKAYAGKNPYEMSTASDYFGKMLNTNTGDPDKQWLIILHILRVIQRHSRLCSRQSLQATLGSMVEGVTNG